MGEVVAFRSRARGARRISETPGGEAQILFFLGVRYMRMDDALAARLSHPAPDVCGKPSGGGKRKRRARA